MDPNLQFSQDEGEAFARIKLSHSTPYYAQGNGQAEASKKSLKAIIEKMIKDNPRTWHNMLSEALWAYRTSKRVLKASPHMPCLTDMMLFYQWRWQPGP